VRSILPGMTDFPITELLDDATCVVWLEQHLHPTGLACPRCQSTDRRLFRRYEHFPAYRCRICQRTYTILTSNVFAKTRQSPPIISCCCARLPKVKVPHSSLVNSALVANASVNCVSRSKPIFTIRSLAN
jgi:hypothetical protein